MNRILYIFIIFNIFFSCISPFVTEISEEEIQNNTVYDGSSGNTDSLQIFPESNPWNYNISALQVHPGSDAFISLIGINRGLHADFGSGTYEGYFIGIPYIVVSGTSLPSAIVNFSYYDESDPNPYIIPDNAPIEGMGPYIINPSGDSHVIVIDASNKILYELFGAERTGHLRWSAGSGAKYNLTKIDLRPVYWTSADAAGLPIFPYLVRYEEIVKGEIKHPIRFTLANSKVRDSFISPARHSANSGTSSTLLPMGARLRLKSGFNISSFSSTNRIILTAMKQYGLILADNGSDMYISGSPDPRWNNDDLSQLGSIKADDFEVIYFDESEVINMP